ncbi:carotenoid oxygenase family protein [Luteolibacter marinus]|uniref:carotenoid oxygenase family protein n=1 Tax=Luteolibacter marinus TaxID=2776705 RepID=UPI001866873D|nr:carotenoid oxygenase family protein [Luteolibacter marinus]
MTLPGYRQSLARPHDFEPVRVEGRLPDSLRGTLYRNGPALFEHGGRRHRHLFEGDGAVCAIRIGDDEVQCAHRLVESEGLREERAAGKPLYGTAASWPRRLAANWRSRFKNTANTSVWRWQERMFALMERGSPTELDPRTLATIGTTTFDGLVASGFSAHPHRVRSRRADYNFGLVPGRHPRIELLEFPWQGAPRVLGSVPLESHVMLHDFIATDRHLVFFIAPVKLQLGRVLAGSADLDRIFRYDPAAGTEIVVVPIDDPGKPSRFRVEAFWQWHFAGAWESGGEIVIDFIRHPDFRSLGDLNAADLPGRGRVTRAWLDPRAKTLRQEVRWDTGCEYPRIDPRFEGGEHRQLFVTYDGKQSLLAKVDLETGKAETWEPGTGCFPSEIVMVPRDADAAEGDGHALSLIYDEAADCSHVAVLDTARFGDGPVARIHLGHRVPMTFHGLWVGRD